MLRSDSALTLRPDMLDVSVTSQRTSQNCGLPGNLLAGVYIVICMTKRGLAQKLKEVSRKANLLVRL